MRLCFFNEDYMLMVKIFEPRFGIGAFLLCIIILSLRY